MLTLVAELLWGFNTSMLGFAGWLQGYKMFWMTEVPTSAFRGMRKFHSSAGTVMDKQQALPNMARASDRQRLNRNPGTQHRAPNSKDNTVWRSTESLVGRTGWSLQH